MCCLLFLTWMRRHSKVLGYASEKTCLGWRSALSAADEILLWVWALVPEVTPAILLLPNIHKPAALYLAALHSV